MLVRQLLRQRVGNSTGSNVFKSQQPLGFTEALFSTPQCGMTFEKSIVPSFNQIRRKACAHLPALCLSLNTPPFPSFTASKTKVPITVLQ